MKCSLRDLFLWRGPERLFRFGNQCRCSTLKIMMCITACKSSRTGSSAHAQGYAHFTFSNAVNFWGNYTVLGSGQRVVLTHRIVIEMQLRLFRTVWVFLMTVWETWPEVTFAEVCGFSRKVIRGYNYHAGDGHKLCHEGKATCLHSDDGWEDNI